MSDHSHPGGLLGAAEPLLLRSARGDGKDAGDAVEGLRGFVATAARLGYPREVVENAAKALRLLSAQEADRAGLQEFLRLLTEQLRRDQPDPDLLDLLVAIYSLGGEQRLLAAGYKEQEMARLRAALLQAVASREEEHPWQLSPRGESDYRGGSPLASKLPVWVAAALAGLVLLGAYQGFRFAAQETLEPVAVELEFIARPDLQ